MAFDVTRFGYLEYLAGAGGVAWGTDGRDRFRLEGISYEDTALYGGPSADWFEMAGPQRGNGAETVFFGGRGGDQFHLHQGPFTAYGGRGDDRFSLTAREGYGRADLLGGDGLDHVHVTVPGPVDQVDFTPDGVWLAGALAVSLREFEGFGGRASATAVTIAGGEMREVFTLDTRRIDADLGAGADHIELYGAASGHIDFGSGQDVFGVRASDGVIVDLANGFAAYSDGSKLTFAGAAVLDARPGADDDRIFGAAGHDMLMGGAGDDVLDGRRRADHIHGGDGSDTLRGGRGADEFVFHTGETGVDLVVDFAEQDIIFIGLSWLRSKYGVPRFFLLDGSDPGVFWGDGGTGLPEVLYDTETGRLSFDPDGHGAREAEVLAILLNEGLPAALSLDQISMSGVG